MQNSSVGSNSRRDGYASPSELVTNDLTSALIAVVTNGSSREEIRQTLAPVCARVRRERMDVADLVKTVKQIFAGAAGATLNGGERQQLLDRIISVCIDEYYSAS